MSRPLEVTILGCGSSGGVPRIGNDWGLCDPNEPKNRRLRCSILVEQIGPNGTTQVLIDTGPDLREQMLNANIQDLDAVLYTHAHADHLHGIDDLRVFTIRNRKRMPVYMDAVTTRRAHEAFGYCFKQPEGSSYPPILDHHVLEAGRNCEIGGAGGTISFLPITVHHGDIDALAFRFNGIGYMPDVSDLSRDAAQSLSDLDTLIIDALRRTPHPSHFSLDDALGWIEKLRPRKAVLTNMHVDMDYQTLQSELPDGVIPAFDGMKFSG